MSENKLICHCCKKTFTKDKATIGFGLFSPNDGYPFLKCPYCGEFDIETEEGGEAGE
jgi:hypothetical protein